MKNVAGRNGRFWQEYGRLYAIRHSSFVLFLGILCLLSPAKASAQSSNRWLFVFNTSAAMRDRTNGMQAVTKDLLDTAMHGTIRPGDTIGIWTYSSELHADEAPLQTWSPKTAPAISYETLLFLRQHRYEKTAAFADVMANLLRVIKISDVITVVLISDGSDPVQGTPFDERIASFYKANSSAQKKARMPVVTLFRGEKGVLTTNTLALAPWPVDIPAVPLPPVATPIAQKPATVEPAAPAKPVPSLVIIGKKAETMFNVPNDLPDHSGEPPAQPPTTPPPSETVPVVAKTETPVIATPETAPKVEEKSKPAPVPVVAAAAPAATPTPTPAASEPPKAVGPATSPAAKSEVQEPVTTKAAEMPRVEAVAVPPAQSLLSARNIAIISVAFTLLVCGFLILSARNARRASRSSLITQSLNQDRK